MCCGRQLAARSDKHATDDEVRDQLLKCRGFGTWSVEYFLLRGLGQFDALPADDIGLRRTIGSYLTRWHRPNPRQLEVIECPHCERIMPQYSNLAVLNR